MIFASIFINKKSFYFIFKISGPAACWVPDRDAGCCDNCAAPLIGSNYTWYTILFHIRPGQEAWALVTSRDILVSIRHVTNVITWPRIYESRSRDRSGGHVTSVIPYSHTSSCNWSALNWAAIIDRPIITHFSMTDISIFNRIRA